MGPKRDLSQHKSLARSTVLKGASWRQVKDLLKNLLCTEWEAKRVHRELREELEVTAVNKGGRPTKVSRAAALWLKRRALDNKRSSNAKVARQYYLTHGVSLSRSTVYRVLARGQVRSKKKRKRARLSPANKRARKLWAKHHIGWEPEAWRNVMWSDESRVVVGGPDGEARCHIMKGQPFEDKHYTGVERYAKKQCMVWGCFSYYGVGPIMWARENIDQAMYKKILQQGLMKAMKDGGWDHENMMFQQDNARVHTARGPMIYLANKKILILDWPAKSADMNPIENLWAHLKRHLNDMDEPQTNDELWRNIQKVWYAITPDICAKYVDSLPRRVEELKKRRGGYTRY